MWPLRTKGEKTYNTPLKYLNTDWSKLKSIIDYMPVVTARRLRFSITVQWISSFCFSCKIGQCFGPQRNLLADLHRAFKFRTFAQRSWHIKIFLFRNYLNLIFFIHNSVKFLRFPVSTVILYIRIVSTMPWNLLLKIFIRYSAYQRRKYHWGKGVRWNQTFPTVRNSVFRGSPLPVH